MATRGVLVLALLALLASLALRRTCAGRLAAQGVKCGQNRCSTVEYCSPYDTHCRPCAEACNVESRNYQPTECLADCQEYLHDRRYALREDLNQKVDSALYSSQREDLLGEIRRLKTLVTVTAILTSLAMLAVLLLFGRSLVRGQKVRNAVRKVFARSWLQKGSKKKSNNKVQDDAEAANGGACKRSAGLKLSMPTISASVSQAPSASNDESTPNTTSTPLSRRHPSEDATLDYAYDNPAMTPSPEAPQPRTKRESSF